jgi:hypothetical protein
MCCLEERESQIQLLFSLWNCWTHEMTTFGTRVVNFVKKCFSFKFRYFILFISLFYVFLFLLFRFLVLPKRMKFPKILWNQIPNHTFLFRFFSPFLYCYFLTQSWLPCTSSSQQRRLRRALEVRKELEQEKGTFSRFKRMVLLSRRNLINMHAWQLYFSLRKQSELPEWEGY